MVFVDYWMRLALLLLALCAVNTNTKRIQKSETRVEEITSVPSTASPKSKAPSVKLPENAIIAIEVIDSNNNSTKEGKGRKRTIESALGYGYNGYQSFFDVKPKPPRFQIYKYSQHDILPVKSQSYEHSAPASSHVYENDHVSHSSYMNHKDNGHSGNHGAHTGLGAHAGHGSQFEIQKSLQYDLGTTVHHNYESKKAPNLQQYYQNGATLFSSVDQNGHLSSLSSKVPTGHSPMVPVIVLRVYTNQLTQPGGLHPNIPNGHPYVNLNNVDLQSLLAGYVQNHPQSHQQQYYESGSGHQQPQHNIHSQHQQPEQVYYQPVAGSSHGGSIAHNHDQNHGHDSGLLTNENYPDDAHTKVIFRPKGTKSRSKNRLNAQKFKITIPENTFSKVEVQEHTYGGAHDAGQYVQQHVEYAAPNGNYDPQQYYYQPQQEHYQHQQEYQPSVQYQQVQQVQQVSQKHNHQPVRPEPEQVQPQTEIQYQKVQPEHAQQEQQQTHSSNAGGQHISPEHAHQPVEPDVQVQHYDPKQYVQIAYSSQVQEQSPGYEQPQHQQPQQVQQTYYQEYVQYERNPEMHSGQHHQQHQHHPHHQQQESYNQPTGAEVQYLQRPAEQGVENQDYSLVKNSNDAGRDLHPKLYNYHAHSARPRGTQKKKRERKPRVPLVLAPKIMDTLEGIGRKH